MIGLQRAVSFAARRFARPTAWRVSMGQQYAPTVRSYCLNPDMSNFEQYRYARDTLVSYTQGNGNFENLNMAMSALPLPLNREATQKVVSSPVCRVSGNTALHVAAGEGDSDLAELLLGFDVSPEIKNQEDMTALELARSLVAGHQAERYKKIVALIKTRLPWQKMETVEDIQVSLSRVMYLIQNGVKTPPTIPIHRPMVMLYGPTQAGKSTLLNYLMGYPLSSYG